MTGFPALVIEAIRDQTDKRKSRQVRKHARRFISAQSATVADSLGMLRATLYSRPWSCGVIECPRSIQSSSCEPHDSLSSPTAMTHSARTSAIGIAIRVVVDHGIGHAGQVEKP